MEEKKKIDKFLQSLWKFCNTENLAQKRTDPNGAYPKGQFLKFNSIVNY